MKNKISMRDYTKILYFAFSWAEKLDRKVIQNKRMKIISRKDIAIFIKHIFIYVLYLYLVYKCVPRKFEILLCESLYAYVLRSLPLHNK